MGISVEVHNLGPLTSAQIELGDLNILVGQNNTGKSFFATVLHRVAAAADAAHAPPRSDFDEIPHPFTEFIASVLPLASSHDQMHVASEYQPDESTLQWLEVVATDLLASFGSMIAHGVVSAYGASSNALRRRGPGGFAPEPYVRITETGHAADLSWSVLVRFDAENGGDVDVGAPSGVAVEVTPPDAAAWLAQLLEGANLGFATRFLPADRIGTVPESSEVTNTCWRLLVAAGRAILLAGCPVEAIHLPAERSGIVQNGRAIVSRFLGQLAGQPGSKLSDPFLTGTAGDLLANLLLARVPSSAGVPPSKFAELADFFERQLGASIELEDEGWDIPTIMAVTPEGRFPLAQASAMLSELAPLLLVAKHRLDAEHCLTIDEPEAHLHPEVQRQVASFLVQVAAADATVILTTHSNFFVGQINNHIRAHALAQLRARSEWLPDALIDPANVRALWFSRGEDGCVAKTIAVDRVDGVDQGVFVDAMQGLHAETAGTLNPLLESSVD